MNPQERGQVANSKKRIASRELRAANREQQKLKILHVIPGLKNASGPTQAALNLATYAAMDGHEVTLAYVSGRGTDPQMDLPERVEILDFPYQISKKWAFSMGLHRYLQQNIQQFDVAHVHGVWLFPNLTLAWNARRKKVPYIVRPAGSLDPTPLRMKGFKKRLYLNVIERHLVNNAAAIHAVSENEARNLSELEFKSPIITIPNGISTIADDNDWKNKEDIRIKLNLPTDEKIILNVGRIHPMKNLEFLGRVFKKLQFNSEDKLKLIIAGPDHHAYAKQLKQYFKQLGIAQDTVFMGEVIGQQKENLYLACDMFALPSHSENFGFVVIEALAAGLPVVVSDKTPWSAVNEARVGYCLPLEEEIFVEKMQALLKNEDCLRESGKRALQFSRQYAWENINQRMIECYQKVIAKA